ncbi:MAG: hypothetical protein IJJ33_13135, partial [Victivallales bacterium]|nr:hypothetical protein [Victivallales bacterium]
MRRFAFGAILFIGALLAVADKASLYKVVKETSPVRQAAFTQKDSTLFICLRLAPGTSKDFALRDIYLFTDDDLLTGRKGIGNEYYFDIGKSQVSSYAPDGRGTLNRNALSAVRVEEWYIVAFDASVTLHNPLQEFEIVFSVSDGTRDRVSLRGTSDEAVELPELPKRFGKQIAAAAPKAIECEKRGAAAMPAEVDVFLASGFEMLRTSKDTTKTRELTVTALRNAFEDFQLAVWYDKPDRGTLRLQW